MRVFIEDECDDDEEENISDEEESFLNQYVADSFINDATFNSPSSIQQHRDNKNGEAKNCL